MTTLPARGSTGTSLHVLGRDGHDDHVTRRGGLRGRRGTRPVAQLVHQVGQGLRTAGVADDDVVALGDRELREGATDVAGADESDSGHGGGQPPRPGWCSRVASTGDPFRPAPVARRRGARRPDPRRRGAAEPVADGGARCRVAGAPMRASLVCVWADPARSFVAEEPDGTLVTTPLDPDHADSQAGDGVAETRAERAARGGPRRRGRPVEVRLHRRRGVPGPRPGGAASRALC